MGETITSPDQSLSWFLRSLGDQDTHPRGRAAPVSGRAQHRAVPDRRWRRSPAPAVVSVPRLPGIDLVDAQTEMAHLTLDAMMTTATVLTCPEAVEVAQAILAAVR